MAVHHSHNWRPVTGTIDQCQECRCHSNEPVAALPCSGTAKPTARTLAPTWRGVMPIIINSIADGGDLARKAAIEELYRLADFADAVGKD